MKQLIRKILKEESLKTVLLSQIEQDGWLETSKLVGGVDNLLSVIGEEKIIYLFMDCFTDLNIQNRGGSTLLLDWQLPIMEKPSSFWGTPLRVYDSSIEQRIGVKLGGDMVELYRTVRRDFIKTLVSRFPEIYYERVDVFSDSSLHEKLDSFKLESKNLKEGISRDRFDSDYADEYPKYKNVLITAIKMEITASGQTEESISLGNSYGEVFVSYRKPSRTLYYDYNWGEDIEKLMPWHIYTRHFKYPLDE